MKIFAQQLATLAQAACRLSSHCSLLHSDAVALCAQDYCLVQYLDCSARTG